jgi:hypothetical protein
MIHAGHGLWQNAGHGLWQNAGHGLWQNAGHGLCQNAGHGLWQNVGGGWERTGTYRRFERLRIAGGEVVRLGSEACCSASVHGHARFHDTARKL